MVIAVGILLFEHLVCQVPCVSSRPIIIAVLEKRKLDNWRNAFLKTTKLVSGKTGSNPGGNVPMAGADSYPAVDPCSPGETTQSLVLWTVAVFTQGVWCLLVHMGAHLWKYPPAPV